MGRLLPLLCLFLLPQAWAAADGIRWQAFGPEAFAASRAENKPLLINLEAVWCHWCHVMDRTTYADPEVAALLNQHYIPVKVDHDARPDLANRYRRWGWPATIVITPSGSEVAKRAGYIEPASMLAMLRDLRSPPTPAPAPRTLVETANALEPSLVDRLLARHHDVFDADRGGLRLAQKFLDGDSVELALALARDGDEASEARARRTLTAAAQLIDPAWGGAYQYSTHGDWQHPHYEKLMRTQARYLRIYAQAYEQLRDPDYLAVIDDIARYLGEFLRADDGAFFVSQDADLVQGTKGHDFFALSAAERAGLGIPRVDASIYAEANGQAIEGLALAARATGRTDLEEWAFMAARRVVTTHRRDDGAFAHAAVALADPGAAADGPYLADNVWMARGLVALYRLSGERRWLDLAVAAMLEVDAQMRGASGFVGGADNGTPIGAVADIDGNIGVARVALALHRLSGDPRMLAMHEHAVSYLADPEVALRRVTEAGIVLVARERQTETGG